MKKVLLFFNIFLCLNAVGQNHFSYRIQHYTSEDGLVHNSANCMVQDEYGFIWIGSNAGLERFDGYEFVTFQNNVKDEKSLSSSRISALYIDDKNTLWIGTAGGGINKYDREHNNFTRYLSAAIPGGLLSSNNISFIAPASRGKLWIGTHGGGLNLFDPVAKTNRIFNTNNSSLKSNDINCYTYDNIGNLWIGTLAGISIADTTSLSIRDYVASVGDLSGFNNTVVRSISKGPRGNIWIGAWVSGIFMFDLTGHSVSGVSGIAPAPEVYDITGISDHEMAFATNKGLYIRDLRSNTNRLINHDPLDPYSLSNNLCISLLKDSSGCLWIGTINSGINKIDLNQKRFQLYKNEVRNKNSLSDDFVNDFEEGWNKDIWISTRKGLNRFFPKEEKFFSFHFLEKYDDDKVNTVARGKYPTLWVGTDYGLIEYNIKTGRYVRHEMNGSYPNCLTNNVINNLYYDSTAEKLWIGTWGGGLNMLDLSTRTWKSYAVDDKIFANNVVLVIAPDSKGNLWLGTYGRGLAKFDQTTDSISFYPGDTDGLRDKVVISLLVDSMGLIWTGSGTNGITIVDPSTANTLNITTEQGLPSNEIAGMLEHKRGEYWISTAKGISRGKIIYDYDQKGSLTILKADFKNFDYKDGLQSNAFNQHATLKASDGRFYFGGNSGFNAFYPDSIRLNPFFASPVITTFELMGKKVEPDAIVKKRTILHKPIYAAREITLHYNENFIGFEFSSMHFAAPEKNQYAYKLENFHDQWIYTEAQRRFLSFTYLKPGDYVLKIKASNNDGIWSKETAALKIHVLPPWWETTWFILLATLSLAGLVFGYIRLRIYRFKKQQQLLEQIIEQRTREIQDQKNDIQTQNEELAAMNEEISSQSDQLVISHRNLEKTNEALKKAQSELERINKNLDHTVKERTQELEKTVKELDRFVYVASHDLGAPLKSVLGLVNITRLDHRGDQLHTKLNMIESSIVKLEKVIFSLKQFSRNSNKEVVAEDIDLNDAVQEIIDSVRYANKVNLIRFELEIEQNLVVCTDVARVKSVLTNLIDNAIKYHDYEKPNPFIAIKAGKRNNHCFIIISDNGQGIDKSLLENVFEMFYRANTNSEGSGLGLYIVKESITKLGGKVKVKSAPGKGTTFIICLPSP